MAPIALFVFNRPHHAQRVLASLQKNVLANESELFVYSDGARDEGQFARIEQTRALFENAQGFKAVHVIARERNYGLSANIIDGVTNLTQRYGQVIVLEDDLELSPHFLTFMNQGLEKYQAEEKICSIHGYSFPTKKPLPNNYFLKGADCWGWATWARAWQHFEADGQTLLAQLQARNLAYAFDYDGIVAYTQMLKDQIAGKNNSWAIRWHASTYLKGLLTLFPGQSLVNNIGNDSSGQHCETTNVYQTKVSQEPITLDNLPLLESYEAREIIKAYHRSIKPSFLSKIASRVKREILLRKHGS